MHHDGPVNALAVTPDGTQIISAGDDSVIRIWDRATEKLVHELTGHTTKIMAVVVTPDGGQIVSASTGGTVRIWDRTIGEQIGEPLGGYPGRIRAMTVTPDGNVIIAGLNSGELVGLDRFSGEEIGKPIEGHTDAVTALAATPDGLRFLSAGHDAKIRIWHRAALERAARPPQTIETAGALSIAMFPDGTRFVSAEDDGTIRIWDAESGEPVGEPLRGHTLWVEAVAVTPDGQRIVSAGRDGTVRMWDPLTRRQISEPPMGHTGAVRAVAISPNGTQIISGGEDGSIRKWILAPGQARSTPLVAGVGAVRTMVLSPDGTQIIAAGGDREVRSWDRATGRRIGEPLTGHTDKVNAVTVTPDGTQIISAARDGTIRIWDRATGQPVGQPLTEHAGSVHHVAITPDGLYIISASDDRTIRVWGRATGQPVAGWIDGHSGPVYQVLVTRDGSQILSASGDHTIRIWDRATGQPVGEPLTGHALPVTTMALSPDGTRLVSAGDDGTIRIWALPTGQAVGAPLTGHESWIGAVQVTPDGANIISGGGDGTIRVWDMPGYEPTPRSSRLADVVSDLESAEDLLGITEDVHTIAAVVAALSTVPPLSIALLGDWGAGKSSFMRQVQDRVWELSRAGGAFAANVKQVRFNAWHYSDDHLWVGLVEHLFAELARVEEAPAESINELGAELSAKEAERDRLEADLKAVSARRGWWGALFLPFRSARLARAVFGGAWRELRSHGWRAALLLAVTGGGVAAAVLGGAALSWVGGVVAGLTVLLGPVVAAGRRLGEYTERARRELIARKSEVDSDIQEVERRLDALDPKRRLDKLLAEISKPERYASYRGLTGLIHRDLRQLSEDLTAVRAGWEAAGSVGPAPLQRIVLYVDDLDRCTPQRVVNVLQAVNLLLTMELFVVVVAVDPGWLLRSLKRHHEGLFDDNEVAYLDKIFHIPVALRPMGGRAVNYLRSLLPGVEEDPAPPVVERERPEIPVQRAPGTPPATPRVVQQTVAVERPVVTKAAPNLNPEGLRLRAAEREFLARLTPMLPTPRAIKKLVNLYRMLRLGVPEAGLNAFVGDEQGGPFQAAALLLATLVGAPREARELVEKLASAPTGDILDVVGGSALGELVTDIRKDVPVHGDTATYRRWAVTVARYGFETYDLFDG